MERTDADELRVSLRKAEAAFAAAEDALRLSAVSHRVIAGMDLISAIVIGVLVALILWPWVDDDEAKQ